MITENISRGFIKIAKGTAGEKSGHSMEYEGFYMSGNKEGFGIEIYQNGDIYIGEFENNLKNGEGVLLYNHAESKYEGRFYMNKKHGSGQEIFFHGSVYIGEFSEGMRTGQGTLSYPRYRISMFGQFFSGKLNGEGKEQTDTFRYKGKFREGLKHEYGIIVYNNGNMYKGNF
jgi:hypothetical protein